MFAVERWWGRDAQRRGIPLALLAGVVLLLHAGLLGGLEWRTGAAGERSTEHTVLQARLIEPVPTTLAVTAPTPAPSLAAPAPPPAAAAATPAATPPAMVARPTALKPLPPLDVTKPALPAPAALTDPAHPVHAETTPPDPAQTTPATTGTGVPTTAELAPPVSLVAAKPLTTTPSTASEREVPVYRTVIPPATSLQYVMRRGALQGAGEFQWLPNGDQYDARLDTHIGGIRVLSQRSQGGFDEAGVAPRRFTDQRLTGSTRAANFQREAGKITFSGPSVEYPLLVGSQDRLSWMVQLAAVVSAEPQRLQPGGKVVVHVVGARGDSQLWVFRFVALEVIKAASGGAIAAAKFMREGTDPHDTRVEVWLDPQQHHLPARALLRSGADDEGLELLVRDVLDRP